MCGPACTLHTRPPTGSPIFRWFFQWLPGLFRYHDQHQLNACMSCACRPGWGPCMSQEAPSGHTCNIYLILKSKPRQPARTVALLLRFCWRSLFSDADSSNHRPLGSRMGSKDSEPFPLSADTRVCQSYCTNLVATAHDLTKNTQ